MGDYFLGEIRAFPYAKIPKGWLLCDGRTLPIQQNAALFSLLGTTYGGDGKTTFAIPNLCGRTIVGAGWAPASLPYPTNPPGKYGGSETVAVTTAQMPTHTHSLSASQDVADATAPTSAVFAQPGKPANAQAPQTPPALYAPPGPLVPLIPLDASNITETGGGVPISTRQPYMAVMYCIASSGVYPSRWW